MFGCNDFGQNSQVWSSLVVSLQLSVHLDKLHNPNCSSPSIIITADGVHCLYSIGFHMTAQSLCPTCFAVLPYMMCASCRMHGAAIAHMCMLPHMHAQDTPERTQTFPFPYELVYLCKKKCRKAYWFHLRIHAKPALSRTCVCPCFRRRPH